MANQVVRFLQYFLAKTHFPEFHDFISMGLGIEARSKRAKLYWRRHLELSKEFQSECLADSAWDRSASLQAIAILGAGRLLDINIAAISSRFTKIDLYDADPVILRSQEMFKRGKKAQVTSYVCDLTGSIVQWTEQLIGFLRQTKPDQAKLRVFLAGLEPNEFSFARPYSTIFSVNVLSQIPIYWRERVYDLVYKHWAIGLSERGELPATIEAALIASMARLQQDHLRLLFSSKAENIVLISDENFFYYTPDQSNWQEEPALYCDWPPKTEDYRKTRSNSWLWHVVPHGTEPDEVGSIHQVRAFGYRRSW